MLKPFRVFFQVLEDIFVCFREYRCYVRGQYAPCDSFATLVRGPHEQNTIRGDLDISPVRQMRFITACGQNKCLKVVSLAIAI